MRYLLLSSSLIATAIVFACSYGNYDGSYSGGADGGDGGVEAGAVVVVTRTIDPAKEEKVSTPDRAFDVTFAAGTFDGPTTITISRLADRLLSNTDLLVPTYTVATSKEPGLPFEVRFTGNSPGIGDPNIVLVPAQTGGEGTFRPTAMVGVGGGGGGPTTAFWGLSRKLGTFSLVYEQYISQQNGFTELMSDSCLARCCSASGGGGTNAGAIGASCACAGPPNLQCFLQNCTPSVAGAIERCVDIASSAGQPVTCNTTPPCTTGGGGNCNYPSGPCVGGQACCLAPNAGTCLGNGGPGCSGGMLVRCDLATTCPQGTQCCVLDNEAYCASTCATERRWCRTQGDCDGGAAADGGPDAGPSSAGPCFVAKNCPHGTCGTPPTACTRD